jgi:hypothetical protein
MAEIGSGWGSGSERQITKNSTQRREGAEALRRKEEKPLSEILEFSSSRVLEF